MNLSRFLVLATLFSAICGCATAINAKSAQSHGNLANSARKAGDWTTARKEWAKALVNAQLAGLPDKQLAVFHYEYGRALGVQCFWAESEEHLQKAYELDHRTNGPEFMSLLELSRLNYDQRKFNACVPYYSHAIEQLEKANAAIESPAEFSVVLEEYATALREQGKRQEADALRARASEIRTQYPEFKSVTDRTPYGKDCSNSQK